MLIQHFELSAFSTCSFSGKDHGDYNVPIILLFTYEEVKTITWKVRILESETNEKK